MGWGHSSANGHSLTDAIARDFTDLNSFSVNSLTFGTPMIPELIPEDDLVRQATPEDHVLQRRQPRSHWMLGIWLSLLAGALMGLMFEPLLLWTNRMKIAGTTVHSFDFFFSLCIGIF